MRKFEHLVLQQPERFATAEELNLMGSQGWRVAGTMMIPDEKMESFITIYTLTREIVEELPVAELMACAPEPRITINIETLVKGVPAKDMDGEKIASVLTEVLRAAATTGESAKTARTKKAN